ncbi:hypothetical protein [Maricaulis maris]|uniref:Uncharacterized protein n=1 Tax=Maricaulis maris TaxID=74318 RepID=A0A495DCS7_9PROT|nr:hypothetical protein [Maricaulis maris]RKR00063.1 hypothetical protein C7435_1261 [Maricaulis maris]
MANITDKESKNPVPSQSKWAAELIQNIRSILLRAMISDFLSYILERLAELF